jgi:hypothetical protein
MVRERVARVGSLRRVRVIWKLSAQISKSYLVAAATSGVPRSWSPRHALGRAWSYRSSPRPSKTQGVPHWGLFFAFLVIAIRLVSTTLEIRFGFELRVGSSAALRQRSLQTQKLILTINFLLAQSSR